MSFTFGFYNSIEKDRLYDAIQVSEIFDGIILDGVYNTIGDSFIVRASEDPNLVVIGPGRAWFNHTWNKNDGYLELELEPPETVIDRIDAVVIDVDERVSSRKNQILIVKGTPSSTPQKPSIIRGPEHNQYPLAYVTRKAATEVISQSQIENAVGSADCPFVTGVLEGLDVDLMLLQWRTAWTEFLAACQNQIDEWEVATKEDVAMFIEEFKLQCNEFVSETEAWQTTQKEDFQKFYNDFKTGTIIYEQEWQEWVDHLVDILDEDALGHLLLELDQLKEDVEKQIANTRDYLDELISGFQAKTTTFNEDGSIVQTYPDGSSITTVFLTNGDIEETLRSSTGVVGAIKTTEFKEDGSIVEKVTGGNYPEFALSKNNGVGEYINTTYNLGNDSFNDIQTIRDVANSTEMMTAIVENEAAWAGLSKSPTAMNAFLSSDISLTVFAAHDSVMETLIVERWDFVERNEILSNEIVKNRVLLKFIFDDTGRQAAFMANPTLLTKLHDSELSESYVISNSNSAPFYLRDGGDILDDSLKLGRYTWAVGWDLYNSAINDPDISGYRVTTTIYPTGEDGESKKYIHDGNEHVEIQNVVIRVADALSYTTAKPNRPGTSDALRLVSF